MAKLKNIKNFLDKITQNHCVLQLSLVCRLDSVALLDQESPESLRVRVKVEPLLSLLGLDKVDPESVRILVKVGSSPEDDASVFDRSAPPPPAPGPTSVLESVLALESMLALATVPRDFPLVCVRVLAKALGVVVVAWRLAVLNSTFSLLARFLDLPESAELFLFRVQGCINHATYPFQHIACFSMLWKGLLLTITR